jgi:hypothetical protein
VARPGVEDAGRRLAGRQPSLVDLAGCHRRRQSPRTWAARGRALEFAGGRVERREDAGHIVVVAGHMMGLVESAGVVVCHRQAGRKMRCCAIGSLVTCVAMPHY